MTSFISWMTAIEMVDVKTITAIQQSIITFSHQISGSHNPTMQRYPWLPDWQLCPRKLCHGLCIPTHGNDTPISIDGKSWQLSKGLVYVYVDNDGTCDGCYKPILVIWSMMHKDVNYHLDHGALNLLAGHGQPAKTLALVYPALFCCRNLTIPRKHCLPSFWWMLIAL